MNPVVTPYQVQTVEAALTAAEAPPRLRTTLYDVMAALQTVVEPDEDDLVVAVMVDWFRSWRITFVRDVTVAAKWLGKGVIAISRVEEGMADGRRNPCGSSGAQCVYSQQQHG